MNRLYGKKENSWFVFMRETTQVNLTEVIHLISNKSTDEVSILKSIIFSLVLCILFFIRFGDFQSRVG